MKFKIMIFALLFGTISFAQKKEKIRGNKQLKTVQHQVTDFNTLLIGENLEVFLLKGTSPQVEIETDENLHEVILFSVDNNGVLSLSTTHQITSKSKLNIRITITDAFNTIKTYEKATVNSLIDLHLNKLSVHTNDNSKLFLTAKTNDFSLKSTHFTKTELNISSLKTTLHLSESASIKSLVNSESLHVDLYQKANAKIEGTSTDLILRADNASNFKGRELTTTNADVTIEGSADCDITVIKNLVLQASGSSKTNIYNAETINIKRFNDSAAIYKK